MQIITFEELTKEINNKTSLVNGHKMIECNALFGILDKVKNTHVDY